MLSTPAAESAATTSALTRSTASARAVAATAALGISTGSARPREAFVIPRARIPPCATASGAARAVQHDVGVRARLVGARQVGDGAQGRDHRSLVRRLPWLCWTLWLVVGLHASLLTPCRCPLRHCS